MVTPSSIGRTGERFSAWLEPSVNQIVASFGKAQMSHAGAGIVERIRKLAILSIRRGCSFAALAIVTFMVGLSPYPATALRCGALLTAIAALVLYMKAKQAPTRNHRQTELWQMLERNPGLPESYAGRVINAILAEEYRRHAACAAWIAAAFWGIGVAYFYL
jgi:hypothetical protein